MSSIVVDANVVAKWYIPEQDHEPARALRDAYLDGDLELLAPALLPYEVITALHYSGHYGGERLREASASFPDYGIDLVPYHAGGDIATIAAAATITVYDAAYLGLAQARDSMVYTADQRLLEKIADTDFDHLASHIRTYGP